MLILSMSSVNILWRLFLSNGTCLFFTVTFYAFVGCVYSFSSPLSFFSFHLSNSIDPCNGTQWDYKKTVCIFAKCHIFFNNTLGKFDWVFNNGFPMLITGLGNLLLIMRVIKHKLQQNRDCDGNNSVR